jgi:hypothetical protein
MAATYTLISSQVLGSSAASVTFSSIPQTYTDLVLKISAKDSGGGTPASINILANSTSGTDNSDTLLYANAGSATVTSSNVAKTYNRFNSYIAGGGMTATSSFSNTEVYIPNYTAAASRQSSAISTISDSTANGYILATASLNQAGAAVTSLIIQASASFLANSSFYLYGIRNS